MKAPTGEGPSMPWCYMLATGTLENKLRGDVGIVITTTSVTIFQSIPLIEAWVQVLALSLN